MILGQHATKSTINRSYNTTVTLTCDDGYELINGDTFKEAYCKEDGTWTVTDLHCFGKYCFKI